MTKEDFRSTFGQANSVRHGVNRWSVLPNRREAGKFDVVLEKGANVGRYVGVPFSTRDDAIEAVIAVVFA